MKRRPRPRLLLLCGLLCLSAAFGLHQAGHSPAALAPVLAEPALEAAPASAEGKPAPVPEPWTDTVPEPEPDPEPEPEPAGPVIALTFDDGPNDTITPQLLEGLERRGVHATFFVLGTLAERYPQVLEQMQAAGNQIGIHGWDHQHRLTELRGKELEEELFRSREAVYQATGVEPLYMRPPYGSIDQATAEEIDMPIMLWTVDPRDWEMRDAEELKQYILEHAEDGAVVLMHDQYQPTLEGALAAIDVLLEQGYRFLTLEQYYQHFGIEPQPGRVYRGTKAVEF